MLPADSVLHGSAFFRYLVWPLMLPVRLYLRHAPWLRGKGIITRKLVLPLLPREPHYYEVAVPGGGRVALRYRDTLGWTSLLFRQFEAAELNWAVGALAPGDVAMDIGANVGLFTVALAKAVGPSGKVICVEPMPDNVRLLQANVEGNGLKNVHAHCCAVGDHSGHADLQLADDAAYPSLIRVAENRGTGKSLRVPLRTLDEIWTSLESPPVRLVKIDVEGAEHMVLAGAGNMLARCRPDLLLEANDAVSLSKLKSILEPLGYEFVQPPGFAAHDFLARTKDEAR